MRVCAPCVPTPMATLPGWSSRMRRFPRSTRAMSWFASRPVASPRPSSTGEGHGSTTTDPAHTAHRPRPRTLWCRGFGRAGHTASVAVGDEVFGMIDCQRDGADAEYVAARADELIPKPATLAPRASRGCPAVSPDRLAGALRPRRTRTRPAPAGTWRIRRRRLVRRPVRPMAGGPGDSDELGTRRRVVGELGADEVIDYRAQRFEDNVADLIWCSTRSVARHGSDRGTCCGRAAASCRSPFPGLRSARPATAGARSGHRRVRSRSAAGDRTVDRPWSCATHRFGGAPARPGRGSVRTDGQGAGRARWCCSWQAHRGPTRRRRFRSVASTPEPARDRRRRPRSRVRPDATPIVVPNTLWQAIDPAAYNGGQPSDITHLADFEASGAGRVSTVAGRGALEIIPAKADVVLDLIRVNSLWPLLSGLACCAIEMISAATSKNDMDRFGMFPFRASPRQADVLIVAGTCTTKMAGPLIRLWDQMPSPSGASRWATARAGRPLQAELLDHRRHRPDHAGGRLHPRLSAAAGGSHLRDDEAPTADQGSPRALAGSGDRADGARRHLTRQRLPVDSTVDGYMWSGRESAPTEPTSSRRWRGQRLGFKGEPPVSARAIRVASKDVVRRQRSRFELDGCRLDRLSGPPLAPSPRSLALEIALRRGRHRPRGSRLALHPTRWRTASAARTRTLGSPRNANAACA